MRPAKKAHRLVPAVAAVLWAAPWAADAMTVRHDWTARTRPVEGACDFRDVALDAEGRSHATGSSSKDDAPADFLTGCYDLRGRRAWVATYDGPAHGHDAAAYLAVDPVTGNTYVTGRSATAGGGWTSPPSPTTPRGASSGRLARRRRRTPWRLLVASPWTRRAT